MPFEPTGYIDFEPLPTKQGDTEPGAVGADELPVAPFVERARVSLRAMLRGLYPGDTAEQERRFQIALTDTPDEWLAKASSNARQARELLRAGWSTAGIPGGDSRQKMQVYVAELLSRLVNVHGSLLAMLAQGVVPPTWPSLHTLTVAVALEAANVSRDAGELAGLARAVEALKAMELDAMTVARQLYEDAKRGAVQLGEDTAAWLREQFEQVAGALSAGLGVGLAALGIGAAVLLLSRR